MSRFQLLMDMGPSPGKLIDLSQKEHYLGRDDSNTIVINDDEISRRHCRFLFTDNGYEIEDLGSTNGSYVNEKRISSRYKLNAGDVIRLGDNVSLVYMMIGMLETETNISDRDTLAIKNEVDEIKPTVSPTSFPESRVVKSARSEAVRPPRKNLPENLESEDTERPNVLLIGCAVILIISICSLLGVWYYIDTYLPEYYCYFLPFLAGCP